MTDVAIQNVADTAFWIAHYRAVETERRDALFRDPLAQVLAGDRGKQIAHNLPGSSLTSWVVVIRTCIIDEYLRMVIASGIDTVVNLGAGLDTRPYRMELPESLVWVEADYPQMIDFKEQRLSGEKPRCRLERVKIDLADASARHAMLERVHAGSKSMLILTEGVVSYLSTEDVASLAGELRALERVRYWIVDYFSPLIRKYRERMGRRGLRNAPFKFKPEDWFAFFTGHGWPCKEMRYLVDEGERLGRPVRLPILVRLILAVRGVFLSGERRSALRRSVGYALLERGGAK
jgi:methyltransferase (TIGR00027 family)